MQKKIISFILAALLSLTVPSLAFADGLILIQSAAQERLMNLFLIVNSSDGTIDCKISNTNSRITGSGEVGRKALPVKTTLLVDISTSVNGKIADEAVKYLRNIVEKLPSNEQIRIVTFGSEINIVHDFTADRYDLDKAVSSLKFDGQGSRIYDAIYNTVPEMSVSEDPCLYRTVVMTDGVDLTDTGITKEELYMMLQSSTYPIDVISLGADENKELQALARISNGRCAKLYPGANYSEIENALSTDKIFWVCAEVPDGLCDGSVRQFDLSIGEQTVQFDLKVPAIDTPQSQASSQLQTSSSQTQSSTSTVSSVESTQEEKPSEGFFSKQNIIIIVGVVIAAAIVAAAIIIAKGGKKKHEPTTPPTDQNAGGGAGGGTEIIGSGGGSNTPFEETTQIILTDSRNSAQKWTFALKKRMTVTVGREAPCDVVISEPSVSHKQLRIYLNDSDDIILENLSTSNPTLLNGNQVISPTKITNNSEIEFGRIKLIFNSDRGRSSIF